MKNLLIGICNDSEEETELLFQHLKIAETAYGMSFDIRTFKTGKDFLYSYCPAFDILFIALPISDMDSSLLLSMIRQRDSLVQIILLSDSKEFYRLGFDFQARNFFIPPVRYRHIYHELERYFKEERLYRKPYLWVSNLNGGFKLYLHKLRYIETNNQHLVFHYGNERFVVFGQISEYEDRLSTGKFFRCNNSYIVNIDYVENIEKDLSRHRINLITEEVIPLSRDKKKPLEKMIKENWFSN